MPLVKKTRVLIKGKVTEMHTHNNTHTHINKLVRKMVTKDE